METVPCPACGKEFTGDDAFTALFLLVQHLKENQDAIHQQEREFFFHVVKNGMPLLMRKGGQA